MRVDFIAGTETKCMNNNGNTRENIPAQKKGLACADIGYVEASDSGLCHFKSSTWKLDIKAQAIAGHMVDAGHVTTQWGRFELWNDIKVYDDWGGKFIICKDLNDCKLDDYNSHRSYDWPVGTQPTYYVSTIGLCLRLWDAGSRCNLQQIVFYQNGNAATMAAIDAEEHEPVTAQKSTEMDL
jgi:hypothetical protein